MTVHGRTTKVAVAFGATLREARTQRGMAQEALAHLAGLDRTYISTLELGRNNPRLDTMLAIADALGIELADLVKHVQERLRAGD